MTPERHTRLAGWKLAVVVAVITLVVLLVIGGLALLLIGPAD
jgi:hypothetical protein